jgi:hypothetical protein
MGSKVLKKTSENSLYVRESPIAPVGHSVHLKKSCGLAYQMSPAESSTSYIKITGDVEFIQRLTPEWEWRNQTHTILETKQHIENRV